MAKRRTQERQGPSRKEQKMTRQEREQARKATIIVGVILGIAVVILIAGLLLQLVIVPNSAVAEVEDETIATRDFWNRAKFEQFQTTNQLLNLVQYQQQLDPTGEQGFFTSQIRQLQTQLADSEGLANQVLEQMIDEEVILQAAQDAGVAVSDQELETQLEELIAAQSGGVTAPQATATAEALAAATPTPTLTPSPTPTTTVETTATVPTEEPQPTPTLWVLTQEEIDQGVQGLYENVATGVDIGENQVENLYRRLVTVDLLRPKLIEAIGDTMPTTGERVQASHILISVAADADEGEQEAALAKAISITMRLREGEDFATLAEQFSDDPGSAAQGGDLGFFGRGQMVPEFEEAAFSLPVGEVSDPVRSQFGYHIILVTDKDDGDPDFSTWLFDQKAAANIVRNLTAARLPNLPPVNPNLLADVSAPVAPPAPIVTLAPEPTPAP